MNKKTFFVVSIVILFCLFIYKIIVNVITDTIDDANKRGVNLYATSIKYAYTRYIYNNNNKSPENISDLDIDITTKVECEDEIIKENGVIELYGCTVEDSKVKYNYVNGKVEREEK